MSVEDAAVSLENTLALTLDKKTCFEVVFIPKRLSSRLRLRPHRANAMLSALAPPARLAPTRARVSAPRQGATRGPRRREAHPNASPGDVTSATRHSPSPPPPLAQAFAC
jgi:hypothetical protein